MRVGVLALQGDVREHVAMLQGLDVATVAVRRASELAQCDALVIPGGESTTISKLAAAFGLLEPLKERIAAGMPTFGTCAGMVLLADTVLDGIEGQQGFGGLNVTVRRNAFGRQIDSFETKLEVTGLDHPYPAIFIRAPWIEQLGSHVEVLASVNQRPVAVRQGKILATSFHPESTDDDRLHRLFIEHIAR